MAEIVFLTGTIGGIVHEVACDDVVMTGSIPVEGWVTSVLDVQGASYDLDAVRQLVVPELPRLFGERYDVLDYSALGLAPPPQISHLVPASIEAGDADVTLHVFGTHFTPRSVIFFNGGAETTVFVSTTELTTTIVGATATTPGAYPVQVQTAAPGGGQSTGRTFYVLNPQDITTTHCAPAGAPCWQEPLP